MLSARSPSLISHFDPAKFEVRLQPQRYITSSPTYVRPRAFPQLVPNQERSSWRHLLRKFG
jgi:hypothetical protein